MNFPQNKMKTTSNVMIALIVSLALVGGELTIIITSTIPQSAAATTISNSTRVGATTAIVGNEDRTDVLQGTEESDLLIGLGGNDIVFGNGGDDIICGGGGDDVLIGGAGNDTLLGDVGNDTL
ncbi:MAG: hypothetical protein ACJ703_00475, partial [Nitrososphaera sp.]